MKYTGLFQVIDSIVAVECHQPTLFSFRRITHFLLGHLMLIYYFCQAIIFVQSRDSSCFVNCTGHGFQHSNPGFCAVNLDWKVASRDAQTSWLTRAIPSGRVALWLW